MGLYDGLGESGRRFFLPSCGSDKNADCACCRCEGMGRSIVPLIAGFLDYDKNI